MAPQLRDLEYFAAIAEHRHMGRAAESLELSQPALSKSVQRLERSLGATLLKRGARGVEPTAAGAALLARVQPLRLALDDVTREVADLANGLSGRIRVGAGSDTAEELLPAACAAMVRAAPNVALQVDVTTYDQLVPALQKGELDLIISGLPSSSSPGLVHEHLYDHEFGAYAALGHRLAKRRRVRLEDLSKEQWACAPASVNSTRALYRAFSDRGLPPPHVAVEISASQIRLPIVAASTLVGFFWRQIVRSAEPAIRLARLNVQELLWKRRVGITFRSGSYRSPAALRFMEVLRTTAGTRSGARALPGDAAGVN
jgi:DNA-binding transcriptional LysR family regulator